MVRKQHLARVKDCKAVVGKHVTTQHKPVVSVVRMEKGGKFRAGVGRSLGGASVGETLPLSTRKG